VGEPYEIGDLFHLENVLLGVMMKCRLGIRCGGNHTGRYRRYNHGEKWLQKLNHIFF
jgi:hypothetical protein